MNGKNKQIIQLKSMFCKGESCRWAYIPTLLLVNFGAKFGKPQKYPLPYIMDEQLAAKEETEQGNQQYNVQAQQNQQTEVAVDVAQLVTSNDTKQLADWLLSLNRGDVQQTFDLLRGVIAMLPLEHHEEKLGAKRARPDYQDSGPPQTQSAVVEIEVADDFFLQDEADDAAMTAVMLIPNDIGLVSHVIGKQGASVMEIKHRTGARVQVEHTDKVPPGAQDRNVFVLTTTKNSTVAVQMIMKKIAERQPATGHTLKVVVPNGLVSKIIGKGGTAIKKLQIESGATVQVAKDLATDHVPVGRTVFLSGSTRQIAMAHYSIMRILIQDKDFPGDWRGGIPSPANMARAPSGQPPLQGASPTVLSHSVAQHPPQMGMQAPPSVVTGKPGYGHIGSSAPPNMVLGAATAGSMQATTRFETLVPEYSVSYIIGKKGSYINEMQRSTSTSIEISKTSENGVERRIAIVGTPDNIQQAIRMLEEKVRDWQSRATGNYGGQNAPYSVPNPLSTYPQTTVVGPTAQLYPPQQAQPYGYHASYPQQPQYGGPAAQPPNPAPNPYQNYRM